MFIFTYTRIVRKVRRQSELRQNYCVHVLCRMAYILLNNCQMKKVCKNHMNLK